MISGYQAPVYVAWSRENSSTIIRVSVNEKNSKSKRVDFRAPDPSTNPYLAVSSIVAEGLDSIKKKMDAGSPVDSYLYKMSDQD